MSDPRMKPMSNQGIKRIITNSIKLVIFIGAIWFVTKDLDFTDLKNNLGKISFPIFLLAAFFNILGAWYFQTLFIRLSIKAVIPRPTYILRANISNCFYNLFLPTAMTAIIRLRQYQKAGLTLVNSTAQVIANKTLHVLGSLIGASALGLFIENKPDNFSKLWLVIFISSIVLVAMIMGIFHISNKQSLSLRMREGKLSQLINTICEAINSFSNISLSKKIYIVLSSVLMQFSFSLCAGILSTTISPGYFIEVMFIRELVGILMILPFSVAGLGVREIGYVGILPMFGPSKEIALAISLTLFLIQLFTGFISGAIELWHQFKER